MRSAAHECSTCNPQAPSRRASQQGIGRRAARPPPPAREVHEAEAPREPRPARGVGARYVEHEHAVAAAAGRVHGRLRARARLGGAPHELRRVPRAGHGHAARAGDDRVAARGVMLDGVGVGDAAGLGAAGGAVGEQVPAGGGEGGKDRLGPRRAGGRGAAGTVLACSSVKHKAPRCARAAGAERRP